MNIKGSIYLTIKDLQFLTGKRHYHSAQREHQTIRDSIEKGKRKLTIKEYCEYEGVSLEDILAVIRPD